MLSTAPPTIPPTACGACRPWGPYRFASTAATRSVLCGHQTVHRPAAASAGWRLLPRRARRRLLEFATARGDRLDGSAADGVTVGGLQLDPARGCQADVGAGSGCPPTGLSPESGRPAPRAARRSVPVPTTDSTRPPAEDDGAVLTTGGAGVQHPGAFRTGDDVTDPRPSRIVLGRHHDGDRVAAASAAPEHRPAFRWRWRTTLHRAGIPAVPAPPGSRDRRSGN